MVPLYYPKLIPGTSSHTATTWALSVFYMEKNSSCTHIVSMYSLFTPKMHMYLWLVLLVYIALFLDTKIVISKLDNVPIIYIVFINDLDAGIECT